MHLREWEFDFNPTIFDLVSSKGDMAIWLDNCGISYFILIEKSVAHARGIRMDRHGKDGRVKWQVFHYSTTLSPPPLFITRD
jgi:hypothetical protein